MADRPFDDLTILDETTERDLLLVSAEGVVYAMMRKTVSGHIADGLGGPGFAIQPDDLRLEIDDETDLIYLTYKGQRCPGGVSPPTSNQ